MLVQAQVVPWWGTGRPAEFHPVTGIAYRQEDRRVRLQNRVVSTTARRALHTLSRNEKSNFFGAPSPGGRSVREITSREETERLPEESTRQIPEAPPVPGTESLLEIWLGRSNRSRADLAGTWTTRVQVRRVPADPTADRKPKAWLQPAPCSSRR